MHAEGAAGRGAGFVGLSGGGQRLMRWLALAGLLLLTGCPSTPSLPPEAGPAPAPIVKVPVLVRLPFSMTQPCPEPVPGPIETDVDLLNSRDAWRVTARCANRKLRDIDKAEQQAMPAAGGMDGQ